MARFLVWSDLHDEFWGGFDLPNLSAPVDGVLIAGEGRHLDIPARAARKYGCPVVVIWGNHEPYGSIWSELLAEEHRQLEVLCSDGLAIRVLHGAATDIAGMRIPVNEDTTYRSVWTVGNALPTSSTMFDCYATRRPIIGTGTL